MTSFKSLQHRSFLMWHNYWLKNLGLSTVIYRIKWHQVTWPSKWQSLQLLDGSNVYRGKISIHLMQGGRVYPLVHFTSSRVKPHTKGTANQRPPKLVLTLLWPCAFSPHTLGVQWTLDCWCVIVGRGGEALPLKCKPSPKGRVPTKGPSGKVASPARQKRVPTRSKQLGAPTLCWVGKSGPSDTGQPMVDSHGM
jgi:hypothetical protein